MFKVGDVLEAIDCELPFLRNGDIVEVSYVSPSDDDSDYDMLQFEDVEGLHWASRFKLYEGYTQELIDRVEMAKSINGFVEEKVAENKGRYGDNIFSVGDLVAYNPLEYFTIESVYNDDKECVTYYTFSDTGGLRNCNGNGLILVKDAADVKLSASETQIAGNHYSKLKIQPMEYCLQNDLNYGQSNAIKYITRYKDKNGIEDLKKAIHCIELLIEFEEKL